MTTQKVCYFQFENLVNYEECKTCTVDKALSIEFENLVNYEECKTQFRSTQI